MLGTVVCPPPPVPSLQHALGQPAVRERDGGRGALVGLAGLARIFTPCPGPQAPLPQPEPACGEEEDIGQRGKLGGGGHGDVVAWGWGEGGSDPSLSLPRVLPDSCAAGSGRKRLPQSRTANGPGETPPARSLNTSLLLQHQEGAMVRAPPDPGGAGGRFPLHYTVNTFSDLCACPAALCTSSCLAGWGELGLCPNPGCVPCCGSVLAPAPAGSSPPCSPPTP